MRKMQCKKVSFEMSNEYNIMQFNTYAFTEFLAFKVTYTKNREMQFREWNT
jgi:hypothetical protein